LSILKTLKIPTARVFEPLLGAARYKGVYGGRGSGKSHFFGELLVETCQAERGTLAVCIREAQRTLAQSSKRLIEAKIASLGLGQGFKLFNDKIETPGDGLIIFRGMHIQGRHHGHRCGRPRRGMAGPQGDARKVTPSSLWPDQ
jgi:phage terminase large subunit